MNSNRPPYPKGWKKTPVEIEAIWAAIDRNAKQIVQCPGNLAILGVNTSNLGILYKKLSRHETAIAIDSAK